MTKVSIIGIGCLCALGNTTEQVWSNLTNNKNEQEYSYGCAYNFVLPIAGLEKRRMTRYTQIALYTVDCALTDSGIIPTDEIREKAGTIFASGYGSLDTNIRFAKQVLTGEPECCSPLYFSNTVANSCLGHICMRKKFKGVSTMLTGSNNIKYAKCMLEEKKAEYIFSGYIEEYNEDLFKSYMQYDFLHAPAVSECVVTFLLTSQGKPEKNTYCVIEDIHECNLGFNPVMRREEPGKMTEKMIEHCIKSAVEHFDGAIDAVFTGGGNTSIDRIEHKAIKKFFPYAKYVDGIKKLFGETLGCSFNTNLLNASLCLKNGRIADRLINGENGGRINSALVNGYGLSGNFISAIVTRKKDS